MRLSSYVRCAVLAAAAALGLHELRSGAGFGGHAHEELAHHGHGYVGPLTLAVGLLLALAVGQLVAQVAAARTSDEDPRFRRIRALRLWWLVSAAVLCICLGQELLEAALVTGTPVALGDLLNHGGWTAIPLAVLFAAAVTLAARGSDAMIASAARKGCAATRQARPSKVWPPASARHVPSPDPLADLAAERAPPLLQIVF